MGIATNEDREHEPRPKPHPEADQGKSYSKHHLSNSEHEPHPQHHYAPDHRKNQEKPDNHLKKDEYDKKHGVLNSFNLFKMSWTKPKFEKLGPMPRGKAG